MSLLSVMFDEEFVTLSSVDLACVSFSLKVVLIFSIDPVTVDGSEIFPNGFSPEKKKHTRNVNGHATVFIL